MTRIADNFSSIKAAWKKLTDPVGYAREQEWLRACREYNKAVDSAFEGYLVAVEKDNQEFMQQVCDEAERHEEIVSLWNQRAIEAGPSAQPVDDPSYREYLTQIPLPQPNEFDKYFERLDEFDRMAIPTATQSPEAEKIHSAGQTAYFGTPHTISGIPTVTQSDELVRLAKAAARRANWTGNYPYRECVKCYAQIHVGGRTLCDECLKASEENLAQVDVFAGFCSRCGKKTDMPFHTCSVTIGDGAVTEVPDSILPRQHQSSEKFAADIRKLADLFQKYDALCVGWERDKATDRSYAVSQIMRLARKICQANQSDNS